MTDKTCWESFKAEGDNVADKIKSLIHEGNVRRVVVQHQGRTIAEFPLTAGVVGTGPRLPTVGRTRRSQSTGVSECWTQ